MSTKPEHNHTAPWDVIYDKLGTKETPFDDRPLGAHVAEHAGIRGNQCALQYFNRPITFSELNDMANRLANVLSNMGVTKETVIGIHLPNIPQYVIALVAISRIGCSGTGVSPLFSPPEIAHQIIDADIQVILTLDSLAPVFEKMGNIPDQLKNLIVTGATDLLQPQPLKMPELSSCRCEAFLSLMENASSEFKQQEVYWNDTFMIQYTGGTTGKPKGAELSVRNLLHNPIQYSCYDPWEIGAETAATAFPMFHVAGLSFAIAGLRFGARSILIPNPRDVEFFSKQLIQYPTTRLGAVPTLYAMLLECPEFHKVDFSVLVDAACGAAPLSQALYLAIEKVIGKNKLYDVFGMTETSPVHTCHPRKMYKIGSVGIPVPGGDTRIVDLETGTRELPFGEAGEIISSGPQIMKGYLNLPDESEKALREWRGNTWMYTGDIGYMDEEGYVYVCDRAKDMLVVGGYKVFSVEVEDKLKNLDFIGFSAVIGIPDVKRPGNDVVNLYVEPAQEYKDHDHEALKETIYQYFKDNMAPYKKPKQIYIVDQIPMTSVGKIDKKVLRKKAVDEMG